MKYTCDADQTQRPALLTNGPTTPTGLLCERKRCSNDQTKWHANNIIGRGVIDANSTIMALGLGTANADENYSPSDWKQFRRCDDLKMTEVCFTTCNHGYYMKDN